jgi:hypothetical protein
LDLETDDVLLFAGVVTGDGNTFGHAKG